MDYEQLRLAENASLDDSPAFTEPRAARLLRLRQLDASTRPIVKAKAAAPLEAAMTFTVPRAFLCSDDVIRWLKAKAQQGLCTEVIGGRLAALAGAGPGCEPILVTTDAIAGQLDLLRFQGHVAGVDHLPGVVSSKGLRRLVGRGGSALPVDPLSRAAVAAHQTWTDLGDPQVLIDVVTGQVFSHDHGDAFAELKKGPPSRIVIAEIPGVTSRLGHRELDIAVGRIEAIPEDEILAAVAGIPDDPGWRATFARRLAIAEWLIKRQKRLREVLLGWGVLPS